MSESALFMRSRRPYVPSPYVEGATYTLELTRANGRALQIRARVIDLFDTSAMCPVMKVALEEIIFPPGATLAQYRLPTDAVLKVYDHRFARPARTSWNLKAFTPEHEAEYLAYANGPRAARTLDELASSEPEIRYLNPDDDNFLFREHYLALTIASNFTTECEAYERLSPLHGGVIPLFYGTTRFLGGKAAPNLNLTKPGILLQYIEGTELEFVGPEQVDIDFLARECLRIIEAYGQLGVMNYDMCFRNFIVKPDGSGVVLVDFADSRLRNTDMNDEEWMKEKCMCDEEGRFGEYAVMKWGLEL